MKEVSLSSSGAERKTERLVINITNKESGQVRKLEYDVQKLSGKGALEAQLNLAEFAREKNRDEIVGSLVFKGILAGTTAVGEAPELITLFDELDEKDQFAALLNALMEAATGSTVGS